MSRPSHEYLLSVGSNVESSRWIPRALELLRARFCSVRASRPYDVAAEGPPGQPAFVNLAVRLCTDLAPPALREACRLVEERCGRVRTGDPYAPRTLDLDVVFGSGSWPQRFGLPHPDLALVGYVLVPCAAIWPEARDPQSGRTLRALADERFPDWEAAHARPEDA